MISELWLIPSLDNNFKYSSNGKFQVDSFKNFELQLSLQTDLVLNTYCQTSNIKHTLIGNKLVDHSDVVGASPVDAAPTTSSFLT